MGDRRGCGKKSCPDCDTPNPVRQKNCIHCGLTFPKCAKAQQKIDDRVSTPTGKRYSLPTPQWVYDQVGARPVSYTHLTLPTICSV